MRQRFYAVDDCDYEQYKREGGTETRAQFFNRLLGGGRTFSDAAPLSKRVAELTEGSEPKGSLSDRVRQLG